jgi:hypothetical protein
MVCCFMLLLIFNDLLKKEMLKSSLIRYFESDLLRF